MITVERDLGAAVRPAKRETGVSADWVITAWVVLAVLMLLLRTYADPDLWGHVTYGADIIARRGVTYHDVYSFTQDKQWINHEWLTEIQMAAAYQAGGPVGLFVLKAVLVVAGLGLLLRALSRIPMLMRIACLMLVGVAAVPLALPLRPQLWSWLFTIVLAWLLLGPPRRSLVVSIPVLFAVWINSHGGVVVGAAMLGLWGAYHAWYSPDHRRLALGIGLCSLLATFINPYGPELLLFLSETVRIGRDNVEWRPIWTAPYQTTVVPWVLTVAAIASLAITSARPRVDRLATMLVFAVASERTLRLVPLFVVISAVYSIPSLATLAERGFLSLRLWAPSRTAAAFGLLPILAFLAVAMPRLDIQSRASCIPIQGHWAPDLTVANALRSASPKGRIVTTFRWSQFAIWHFGPGLRVSYDGRMETLYSDAVDALHVEIWRGEREGPAFLDRVRPEDPWLGSESGVTREWLRAHSDYRIDLQTSESFLAVRRDQPLVSSGATVTPACFPG